jgi:hypothetical protein
VDRERQKNEEHDGRPACSSGRKLHFEVSRKGCPLLVSRRRVIGKSPRILNSVSWHFCDDNPPRREVVPLPEFISDRHRPLACPETLTGSAIARNACHVPPREKLMATPKRPVASAYSRPVAASHAVKVATAGMRVERSLGALSSTR